MEAKQGTVTVVVATVKDALLDPAGTVTLGGTPTTDGLSVPRETVRPPAGAAPVRFAVPCAVVPPTTVVGLTRTDDSAAALGIMVNDALTVTP